MFCPPQDCTHTGNHFHDPERFGDEVVCPRVKAFHPVVFRVFRGQHNDRQPGGCRFSPQAFQYGDTVFSRKHDIQDGQLRNLLFNSRPELIRRFESPRFVSLAFQGIDDQLADTLIVLQQIDQNAHLLIIVTLYSGDEQLFSNNLT